MGKLITSKITLPPFKQKALLGVALAFAAVYKFVLSDPDIIKSLDVSYVPFKMVWTIVMCLLLGLSGWEFVAYFPDPKKYLPERAKEEPSKE